jgi:hypothetical protein
MRNDSSRTMILCAGPGLGFYVPGLILSNQLNKEGLSSGVAVFESLFVKEKSGNIALAREKFHKDFSFARMAQKMAKDPSPFIDGEKLRELFANWDREEVKTLILLSGFWIPVVNQYVRQRADSSTAVVLCHLDAANSTSWDLFGGEDYGYRHVWFCNWEKEEVNFHLAISPEESIPFEERTSRVVVHGGGWGLGTYNEKISPLGVAGFDLDIIAYQYDDMHQMDQRYRYYLLDPLWNSWEKDMHGNHCFPPSRLIHDSSDGPGPSESARQSGDSHYLYELIRRSKAIVSKPGAGTLIDSLSSATPLVYLDPFGEYERKNALLWNQYGLGIAYDEWEKTQFSESVLQKINRNLVRMKARTQSFTDYIMNVL